MNRTVKSCFAAGAAFAALALASAAQAQAPGATSWSMSSNSDTGAPGRVITITVAGDTMGSTVNVAQSVLIYDSTFLTLDPSVQAGMVMHPDAVGRGWGEQLISDTAAQPTNALWPAPLRAAKILGGLATAAADSGNLFNYTFRWTGGLGSTTVRFSNERHPDPAIAQGAARTRFSNAGLAPSQPATFSPAGGLTLTAVPAPSAVLAFAAGLPLLGVALRRRK